jgi:EmrB/QacA subfamily drug resistance transporter
LKRRAVASSKPETSPSQRLGLVLGLLVTAQFAVVVDFSIVQIALPTIRGDLGMSLADSQWIISAYGVTFAGFLLLSGRLSDIYGSKKLFLVGLVIFSLSSLSAGLANTELVLIGSRVVQGIGAAVASATGLAMITRIFSPLGRLNQALGIFTAVSSAGFTAGVLLGGIITEALGWRWIFFVNVPIGLLGTLFSYLALPRLPVRDGSSRHLDLPGALSITAGLMLFVYGLSEVGNGVTDATTYVAFGLSGATIAAFLLIESRSKAPIIHLGFLKRKTIFFANATALLTFATTVPWIFFTASYLQVLLRYSPLDAAIAFVPGSLTYFFLGGFGAPRLVKGVGARPVLVVAMLALASGLLLTSRLSAESSYLTAVLPAMLVASAGGALSATAANIAALAGAQRGEEGVASGLINTSRQVGGPVGLAMSVSVVGLVTHGGGLLGPQSQVVLGIQDAFLAAASFAVLAVVTSLLIPGKKGKEVSGTVPTAPIAPDV